MLRTRPVPLFVILVILVILAALVPATALAQWPPPEDVTRDQIAMRMFWPADDGYARQWQHWSWVPSSAQMQPGFRTGEAALGAGNNTDRAWGISVGDRRVLIAVLDSGIKWEEEELQGQAAINQNELPRPRDATGADVAFDANGDGVVNIFDYANDARVPCGVALPHPMRACMGMDGMPNDPNRNGVLDAGDLIRVFSNGIDEDMNGYVDDISGWDFFMDDNEPYDDTRFGHGTGEANWSVAAQDGRGRVGGCPRCMYVPLRAGDSFITDVNDFAQAAVYATDLRYGPGQRVRVIQEALGTINNSTFATRALDYAYANDVLVVASAADENSRHHNMPGTNNHAMYVHAIQYNGANFDNSTTFLSFNNCTNYGGQLQLSVAGTGCSSEATGQSSGIAGLMFSAALRYDLMPTLRADEARQLFVMTTDDINIPESVPGHPMYNLQLYPSLPGWDQRFGYGRPNARRALEWIRAGRIPPEVDITSPRWFTVQFADRDAGRRLRLEGTIAARRARSFDYAIEWARGIEPRDADWQMVRTERNVTAPVTGMLSDIDVSSLMIDNPGEIENRYTITVRIRATAHYDMPAGDTPGEARRVFYVHRDPTLFPGWPVDVVSSGESSPRITDLNRDGRNEVIVVTSDGLVHAMTADGRTELPGFPVHTNPELGFDPARMPNYRNGPAYRGATPVINPDEAREAVLGTPSIGDIDNNGDLELVVGSYHGTIYVWNHDGTPYRPEVGYPVRLPPVRSPDTGERAILAQGTFGPPVLADLNGDRTLEIIVGGFDGKVHVFTHDRADVTNEFAGFPVNIEFPEPGTERNRVWGPIGIGRMNNDSMPDLVVVSNVRMRENNNLGAIWVLHGDGNNHAGGAFHPNWPIAFTSFNFFPLVGSGISSSPAIADVDGDGIDEIGVTGNALPTIVIARGTQPAHTPRPTPGEVASTGILRTERRGALSNFRSSVIAFAPVFSLATWADMNGDRTPDFLVSGAGLDLAINLAGGARRVPFDHLQGGWDGRTGEPLPGFPRIIEDYTFFQNAAVADVSGDGYPEVIVGTGGYYLRAFDACGREAAGFPHFTGQWIIPSPAVGDLDGDGNLDVVTNTRSGYLYAWRTTVNAQRANVQWPTYRHDERNTGNYGTALTLGSRHPDGLTPLQCPAPVRPDAGVTDDAGTSGDAGGDGGRSVTGSGCGCRTASNSRARAAGAAMAALAIVAGLRRRRRIRSVGSVRV